MFAPPSGRRPVWVLTTSADCQLLLAVMVTSKHELSTGENSKDRNLRDGLEEEDPADEQAAAAAVAAAGHGGGGGPASRLGGSGRCGAARLSELRTLC